VRKRRQTFKDGSRLTTLPDGSLLLQESRLAQTQLLTEQLSPYHKPPPRPKLKRAAAGSRGGDRGN
jgi:hypothetical protein